SGVRRLSMAQYCASSPAPKRKRSLWLRFREGPPVKRVGGGGQPHPATGTGPGLDLHQESSTRSTRRFVAAAQRESGAGIQVLLRARAAGRFSSAVAVSALAAAISTIARKNGIGGLDSPVVHFAISPGVQARKRARGSTPPAISIARARVRR